MFNYFQNNNLKKYSNYPRKFHLCPEYVILTVFLLWCICVGVHSCVCVMVVLCVYSSMRLRLCSRVLAKLPWAVSLISQTQVILDSTRAYAERIILYIVIHTFWTMWRGAAKCMFGGHKQCVGCLLMLMQIVNKRLINRALGFSLNPLRIYIKYMGPLLCLRSWLFAAVC